MENLETKIPTAKDFIELAETITTTSENAKRIQIPKNYHNLTDPLSEEVCRVYYQLSLLKKELELPPRQYKKSY